MKPAKKKLLIIIPCYNESGTVREVVERVKSVYDENILFDPLVIDDGSSDRTYELACRVAKCVRLPVNLGIGGAVQTGFKYAYENSYDGCIQIDGDGQHEPAEMVKLTRVQNETGANIVVGSRFKGDQVCEFQSTFMRRCGISFISLVFQVLYRKELTDPTSGFRLMDRKAIELFARSYPVDYPEPISLGQALRTGLQICEIPVEMYERKMGNSSIYGIKCLFYMLRVVSYLGLYRFL